jgi:Uma2 family endonuclease
MAVSTLNSSPIELPIIKLPTEDGEPLETKWHRAEINLLIDSITTYWADRHDYFVGGNMFVYYSFDQVRHRDYRGPDFFVVLGVDGSSLRDAWVVWEEQGRYPDVIVELLSESTAIEDKTTKKLLYEQTFRTPHYFLYEPARQAVQGFQLTGSGYEELVANAANRLWCSTLGLWLGSWAGSYLGEEAVWLRFFDAEGNLVRTAAEVERDRVEAERRRAEAERQRAEVEHQRAEAERRRAEAAELRAEQTQTELERLRGRLRAAGIDPDGVA